MANYELYPAGIHYDEQGRPFTYVGGTSRRSYISPVAMGTGQRPEDTTGIFRQGPQWNNNAGQWETPIDWGNIATIATGAGLGVGAASAAGAFGGAASGAGGGLSEAAIPTATGLPAGGAGLPGAGMVGALPASQIAPAAGTLPAGSGGLASGAGSALAGGSRWLGPALALGTGLAGRVLNQGGGNNMMPIPPQLTQLLDEATRRAMNQGPLSDAITRQALAGLPTYARG